MANNTMELLDWFRKQVEEADPDFLRGLVSRGLSASSWLSATPMRASRTP